MKSILFTIFFPIYCFSQYSPKNIDTLLVKVNVNPGKDYILKNKKIIDAAGKIEYTKGEAIGYIQIASELRRNCQFKESLKLLNLAKAKAIKINENSTYGKLYLEYAQVHHHLGLSEIAIKYNNLALSYLLQEKSSPDYRSLM